MQLNPLSIKNVQAQKLESQVRTVQSDSTEPKPMTDGLALSDGSSTETKPYQAAFYDRATNTMNYPAPTEGSGISYEIQVHENLIADLAAAPPSAEGNALSRHSPLEESGYFLSQCMQDQKQAAVVIAEIKMDMAKARMESFKAMTDFNDWMIAGGLAQDAPKKAPGHGT